MTNNILTPPSIGLQRTNPLAIHCTSVCNKATVCMIPLSESVKHKNLNEFFGYKNEDVCNTCYCVSLILMERQTIEISKKKDETPKQEIADDFFPLEIE